MKPPLEPVDLPTHAARGLAHIARSVDRAQDCRPYFRFNLTKPPLWCQHEAADTPHTVGRFLHALHLGRDLTPLPDDAELLQGLRRLLYASLDRGDGFAWDDTAYEPHPVQAYMHHQREALLGLVALGQLLDDGEAADRARALVAAVEKATRATGTFPQARLGPQGWSDDNHPPTTSGRFIDALLAFSRQFDAPEAVDLALRLGRHILATSFSPEGQLAPAAGTHIHSITGTVAALVDLGMATGEDLLVERARLVFDHGLAPYRSRSGWVKESLTARPGRGEANCTADLIEAACLLGRAGHSAYCEIAERMLRNHLLASQLDDMSWVAQDEAQENTADRAFDNLRGRAQGAFCFADPNGFHSYNSDLTGAAIQGLAAAWRHIATAADDRSYRINLLFSRDHPALCLTSLLPRQGRLVARAKRPLDLALRLPPWVDRATLQVRLGGHPIPVKIEANYLQAPQLEKDTLLEVEFAQPSFIDEECLPGHEQAYRTQWLGSTATAMSGGGQHMALYPAL